MANGSVKIGGGNSITIECDETFKHSQENGRHKVQNLQQEITEVVITDGSEKKAYLKFDVQLLPAGEKFFVKVNYKAKGARASAATP